MNFTIRQRETMYKGRAFEVQRVLALLPNGREQNYDLVSHRNAITIVPLDTDGKIWFVRQYRLGAEKVLLELPAGVLEAGEDPLAGARREIREEIGMAAGEMTPLGDFFMAPGYSSEFMHIFLATGLYPAPLQADADEFLQVESLPVRQVMDMVRSGQIQDGKSLAALLLAQPHLV